MGAQERYKQVQREARLDVKEKLSNAGRLDLWAKVVAPSPQLVVKTSINCGFTVTDAKKLVYLFNETLAVRAL